MTSRRIVGECWNVCRSSSLPGELQGCDQKAVYDSDAESQITTEHQSRRTCGCAQPLQRAQTAAASEQRRNRE